MSPSKYWGSLRSFLAGGLAKHGIGTGAVVVGLAITATVLTNATFIFIARDIGFTYYYDSLGDSMLQGRFDVPYNSIKYEVFLLHGGFYGYFGPTPAVLRMPLKPLFPDMRGQWTRLSMLLAAALTLAATHSIASRAQRWTGTGREDHPTWFWLDQYIRAFFVLTALVGTQMIFIMRVPILYHEACAWGVAGAMIAYACLLHYQESGRAWALFAAFLGAIASFQARGSVGAGPMAAVWMVIALLVVTVVAQRTATAEPGGRRASLVNRLAAFVPDIPTRLLARHTLAIVVVAGLATAGVLYKNYLVFGNLAGVPPMRFNVQLMNKPERLARTDGGNFVQVRNLRTSLYNYFVPTNIRFGPVFPYYRSLDHDQLRRFPETKLDFNGPFASLTAVNPFWCIVTGVGIAVITIAGWTMRSPFARFLPALLGAAVGGANLFIVASITQRYLYDLFPLFVVGGAAGFYWCLNAHSRSAAVRAVFPLVVLAAIYTCYANLVVSLTMRTF